MFGALAIADSFVRMEDDEEGPGGTRVLSPDGPQTRAVAAAIAAQRGGVHTPLATQPTEVIDTSQWRLEGGQDLPQQSPGPHAPLGRTNLPTNPGHDKAGWTPMLVTIVVVAAIAIAGGTFALVLLLSKPKNRDVAPSASASALIAPPRASSATVTAPPPAPSASAGPTEALPEADAQARAALEKLAPLLAECAEKKIHNLPGGSPAVPDTFGWLKGGAYPATDANWNNPFFVCTTFRIIGPMPFVFQWQVDKPGVQGTALVWVDGDSDGKPDRAYAFTATMESKDKMTVGPIGPADAARPLAIAPRAF
ncbi:MAG: hypothetical protein U0414_37540 [Polyangiaceae bacterium]